MFSTNTMHVVVNKETNEEHNYQYAIEARHKLIILADAGINAYIYTCKTIKTRIN